LSDCSPKLVPMHEEPNHHGSCWIPQIPPDLVVKFQRIDIINTFAKSKMR
jgi:hypothetical protein